MKKRFVAAGLTCMMTLSVFGTSALAASDSQADPPSVEKETVPHVHTCAISTADANCTHDVDILAGKEVIFVDGEYRANKIQPRVPLCPECSGRPYTKACTIIFENPATRCSTTSGLHFTAIDGEHWICSDCEAYVDTITTYRTGIVCSNRVPGHTYMN